MSEINIETLRVWCNAQKADELRLEAARMFTGAKRAAERGEICTATDYLRFALGMRDDAAKYATGFYNVW